MAEENIHANHRSRMRKIFIEKGLDAFPDHEVLEILLFYCYPRRDTNALAHEMIKRFGSLNNLMDADAEEIKLRCGVNENTAVLIRLIPSFARRYIKNKSGKRTVINNEKEAAINIVPLFAGATVECFFVLCLDKQYRLIYIAEMPQGTLDETAVYMREVMKAAIKNNAAKIILTHNHPGGSMKPSRADLENTRNLIEGLRHISVEVVDHIIVAGDKIYSMASRGQYVAGY